MAGKTLINGTAYTIGGGRTLIGGTGYSIKSGKTLIGGTAYTISFGTPVGSLAVGSSLFMNYNGTKTEFLVIHQGLPSSIYDSSCNGTWVMIKKMPINNEDWNNYEEVYNPADADGLMTALNQKVVNMREFITNFDEQVRNTMKTVKIPYSVGGYSSALYTGSNGFSCKMFLLSASEVGFVSSAIYQFATDGAKLDYFESGTSSSANEKRICYYGTDPYAYAEEWWMRTPTWNGSYNGAIVYADKDGTVSSTQPDSAGGVRFAFIFPPNTIIDGTYISLS